MDEGSPSRVKHSVTDLPFNRHLGLLRCGKGEGLLELPAGPQFLNHLGTVHAGALLALAEAATGEFLLRLPDLPPNLVPVVRRLESKFRKPGRGRIVASASAQPKALARLGSDLTMKGRSLISITVDLFDESGTHVLSGAVDWYLQIIDPPSVTIRPATDNDIPAIKDLIPLSVHHLQAGHYSTAQREAALGPVFGLDRSLIRDGTYFVAEVSGRLVGCGGWSRRRATFGGDHDGGADEDVLDPATDAARIRAFFVHPDFARQGIGTLLLQASEKAVRTGGFQRAVIVATLAGEPLYLHHGYETEERFEIPLGDGLFLPAVRMGKSLAT